MFATKEDRWIWVISTAVIITLIIVGRILFTDILVTFSAVVAILVAPFVPTLIFRQYHKGNKRFIVQLEIENRIEECSEELQEIADDIRGDDTSRDFIDELADGIVNAANGLMVLKESLGNWDSFYRQIQKDKQHYAEQYAKSKAEYEERVRNRERNNK